ncbi:hypothetical protein K432DRAFT_25014 [Lepidopterella palustris CBS 459.81]|uniref:Uncharacterized protein n=1 Tax=Lepidopterella palustris CBS 459.81 TaxID=1314670 RepID=A0A8E2EBW8_9PEZI|nr:hypothetical protein K432DRAFT_25014 [Lepidopterella palustris CBS 459.81]
MKGSLDRRPFYADRDQKLCCGLEHQEFSGQEMDQQNCRPGFRVPCAILHTAAHYRHSHHSQPTISLLEISRANIGLRLLSPAAVKGSRLYPFVPRLTQSPILLEDPFVPEYFLRVLWGNQLFVSILDLSTSSIFTVIPISAFLHLLVPVDTARCAVKELYR